MSAATKAKYLVLLTALRRIAASGSDVSNVAREALLAVVPEKPELPAGALRWLASLAAEEDPDGPDARPVPADMVVVAEVLAGRGYCELLPGCKATYGLTNKGRRVVALAFDLVTREQAEHDYYDHQIKRLEARLEKMKAGRAKQFSAQVPGEGDGRMGQAMSEDPKQKAQEMLHGVVPCVFEDRDSR